ncbi:MAG: twin-arginine translocase subunit TatC [Bdellovibrionaceae bacterium]|nr:twin-arginine translocase subunit TatC [Pseudobdellovibrionaceae bacterium]|tara:strand:+ start:51 stop:806 length:756 start_codon:yes stop_codon:yes gene_type:complete
MSSKALPGTEESDETLVSHLTELRRRLVYTIITLLLGFFACWNFSEQIFDFIRLPIAPYLPQDGLVFTAPMDKFLAHIKVCLLASIVVTSPLWIYQIWAFIAPALYKEERKFGLAFIFFGTILFLSGVSFLYFLVMPMAFKFLLQFGGEVDKAMITIKEYLSFFITTTLVFGVAFEMPLMFAILAKLGVVSPNFLINNWRYAVVILAAGSAMFTPPDVISMVMMMIPMLGLYGLSIILVSIIAKDNEKSQS